MPGFDANGNWFSGGSSPDFPAATSWTKSADAFSNAGGGVSSLFEGIGDLENSSLSAESLNIKAQGDLAEAQNYDLAATLAQQEEAYTQQSTAIQALQADRQLFGSLGTTKANVAGAGFADSGSALDIMRDSASQGALAKGVLQTQGYITEQGYQEQAKSYETMAAAATTTAGEEQSLASQTQTAGEIGAAGSFASSALKFAAAAAPFLLA